MGPSECLQFLRFIFDIHMSGSLKRLFECRLKSTNRFENDNHNRPVLAQTV